ncbi:DUF4296 domain-containing protein [Aurantibacter crassamenti]|uniref:DUF4296 domain-containing protein n=1 Tax=Aurantibacter crassamenti TaxID=1837375 RepID=UPI00193A073F|nr:DUF4296 domain-containing protein [Aurantibacter crassamenti]MBM1104793.1 DUF4296 domain-containing protein [Aurantibacter crassamenti]
MKKILFLLVFVLLTSCAEQLVEGPEGLIPSEKMVDILNDMAILNAAKTTNSIVLKKNGIETMKFIFEKHGIDSTQFVLSDRYYASKPVEYESIYSKVAQRLEVEEKRLKDYKKTTDSLQQVVRDSIK